MSIYSSIVALHLAAGSIALVTFWLTASQRKGSDRHRFIGRAYLIAMTIVIGTGAPLALAALMKGQYLRGAFLTYLLTLTASACWRLWRAIRDRRSFSSFSGAMFRGLAALNAVFGAGLLIVGATAGSIPMLMAASAGVGAGIADYRLVTAHTRSPRWWFVQHFIGVAACGFATHVTFIAVGLARLVPEHAPAVVPAAWIATLCGAALAVVWFVKRYPAVRADVTAERSIAQVSS